VKESRVSEVKVVRSDWEQTDCRPAGPPKRKLLSWRWRQERGRATLQEGR